MFGTKNFKKAKAKKFDSEKERKRFFAIQSYYKKKEIIKICVIEKKEK